MSFYQKYLKHLIKKNTFKLLIVIGSILLVSLLINVIFADQGKDASIQKPKSLEQQINILKDKVDRMDKTGVTGNNNLTEQTSKMLSISSDTVKYVGVIASIILPLIILLIGYQVIRSYQFEREFRDLRKLMTDEYEKILKIRTDAERFMSETKSNMANLGDFIGDLATKYLMSKTSELIREEKEERDKIFEEVKTQVSEVKTSVKDEKDRNMELMKKLEALDLTLTPTVYIERGSIYLDQGNFAKAIENFNEAIRLKGNESKAYSLRGTAYFHMKDFDKAIEDFTKLTNIEPKNANAFIDLGICYIAKQNYDKAMEKINKAIELNFNDDFAHYQKARIYHNMGKYDLAINELKEAIKIRPDNRRYLGFIGLCYANMGDNKNAIQYYLKSIAIYKNLTVMENLTEAYICDGNYTEAEKLASDCYSMALTTHDKVMSKYLLLLALILNKKEYKIELKEFAKIVESSSDFSVGEWSFGEILNCLKNDTTIPVQSVTLVEKIISFLKREIKGEEILS